ncbi:MAG: hypothetical protein R2695_08780 [Acidimicrobiales bacterium]
MVLASTSGIDAIDRLTGSVVTLTSVEVDSDGSVCFVVDGEHGPVLLYEDQLRYCVADR